MFAVLAAAPQAADPPRFDPIAFFTGYTEGAGDLRIMMRGPAAIEVHGHGEVEPDGTLVLDQRVERYGKPAQRREWRIRRVAPGRYTGTLTDAVGPVTGEAIGDRLHLTYRMKDHLAADQWLTRPRRPFRAQRHAHRQPWDHRRAAGRDDPPHRALTPPPVQAKDDKWPRPICRR